MTSTNTNTTVVNPSSETTKAAKRTTKKVVKPREIFTAHYTEFVRNDKNLRSDVEREELLIRIKADGGAQVPGYVYPEKTEEGKYVLFDGNSRHWCLEQLVQDPEYKGSLELPFLVLDEDIANNPVRERLFMISLGTSNEQLTPKEIGKGYVEAYDLRMDELIKEIDNWDSLSEEEQEKKQSKLRTKIIKEIIKYSGSTSNTIYGIFRVYHALVESPALSEALDNDELTLYSADELIKIVKRSGKDLDDILAVARRASNERGKDRISEKDLRTAEKVVKHEELKNYVETGVLSPNLTDQVLDTAKTTKLDIPRLLSDCVELGGVTPENLENIKEEFDTEPQIKKEKTQKSEKKIKVTEDEEAEINTENNLDTEGKQEDEDDEIKEESQISGEELQLSLDLFNANFLKLSAVSDNLDTENYSKLDIITVSDKLDGLVRFIEKLNK